MSAPIYEWEWLARQPGGFHIAATILMGQTHDHLLSHDIVPGNDKTRNLWAHIEAHRESEDA